MQIEVKNISYTYNLSPKERFKALDNVSFSIEKGEFVAVVGKTGAGKSTLMQMLNGLLFPDEGEVDVDEFVVSKDKKKRSKKLFLLRKKVGLVFQFPEYQLFEETVLKDVEFGPKNFGDDEEKAASKAKKALSLVGLDASYYERSPFELSGGEKRRAAIAGIIALEPKVLVLDEPTAGLDPNGEKEMMGLFYKIYESGQSVIIVTHNMELVLKYVDQAAVMADGKMVKMATPLELFQDEAFLKTS